MRFALTRQARMAVVVTGAACLAVTVVVSNGPTPFVCNVANNNTTFLATNVLGGLSAAIQLAQAPMNATRLAITGALVPFRSVGSDPVAANFTVIFRNNTHGVELPGTPLLLEPLGGGHPLGPLLEIQTNLTPTGQLTQTPNGPQPEYAVDLNIPDIELPAPPFWIEVFNNVNPATNTTVGSLWSWSTADANNITPRFAESRGAPGSVWRSFPGALTLKLFAARAPEGACCTDEPGAASECILATQADCEADGGLFVGGSCDLVDDCVPLIVEFESVDVRGDGRGVLIEWTTSLEVDTVGFRVLRENTDRSKSTEAISSIIPAMGAGIGGGSYRFLDNAEQAFEAERYYIEDLDIRGRWTRHGPFEVQRFRETPVRTRTAR